MDRHFTHFSDHRAINDFIRIIYTRAEADPILNTILDIHLAFVSPDQSERELEKVIGCAIDQFSSEVMMPDSEGHEQILDEILVHLKRLNEAKKSDLAVRLAEFTITKGHQVVDNFEEGWLWHEYLNMIMAWKDQLIESD